MQQQLVKKQKRVIPTDSAFKVWFFLLSGAIICIIVFITGEIRWPEFQDITQIPGNFMGLFLALFIFATIYIWPRRTLEKKRQRAAKWRITGGQAVRQISIPYNGELATSIKIRMQRSWSATYYLLAFFVIVAIWSNWSPYPHLLSSFQQLIRNGFSLNWLQLIGLTWNILFFCLYISAYIYFFVYESQQQLIATQDGLHYQHGLRVRYIPWHEARFFALIQQRDNACIYELASEGKIIRWASHVTTNHGCNLLFFPLSAILFFMQSVIGISWGTTQPTSQAEYGWQAQMLTAIVAAQTGLPLYDLR